MCRKLLHLPIPFADESPGSLLLRTTEYNGWKSSSALLIALNYQYSKGSTLHLESIYCDQKKWNAICDLLSIENTIFISKCYRREGISTRSDVSFMGVSIPWRKLRLKEPAICPICIAETNYQKSIWDFKLITACSIHKTKLINKCPKCKNTFGWNRKKISECSCGFNIKDYSCETVDTEDVEFIENLITTCDIDKLSLACRYYDSYMEFFKCHEESLDDNEIAKISILSAKDNIYMRNILHTYIRRYKQTYGFHPRITLGPFLTSKNKRIKANVDKLLQGLKRVNSPSNTETLKQSISLKLTSAILGVNICATKALLHCGVLQSTEKGIGTRVEIQIESINCLFHTLITNGENKRGIRDLMTNITVIQHRKISSVISDLVSGKTLFYSYKLNSKGLTGISLIGRPFGSGRDIKHLSLLETAQICNVHYENIRFAVKCGVLERVDAKKTKGTQIFIDRKVAYNFNKLYVFSGSLALKHKCNPRTLSEKLMASGIRPISGPKIDGGLTYLFQRKDIKSLNLKKVDALRHYPTNTGRKNSVTMSNIDYSISLASAAKMLNISTQTASQLIINGSLTEYEDLYRRKSVTYESFNKIYDILNNPNSKALQDAAQALDQTEREFTLRYITTKLIQKIDTGRGFYLSEAEFRKAKNFNELYITSKEAGKLLNTHSSYLNNLKRTNKIKVAKEIGLGSYKISFFCRNEVLALKAKS